MILFGHRQASSLISEAPGGQTPGASEIKLREPPRSNSWRRKRRDLVRPRRLPESELGPSFFFFKRLTSEAPGVCPRRLPQSDMGGKWGCVCDEGCSQVCRQHGFMLGARAVVQEDSKGGCTLLGHWAMPRFRMVKIWFPKNTIFGQKKQHFLGKFI